MKIIIGLMMLAVIAFADDHGNTRETATTVELNSTVQGRIEVNRDVDYFKVTTPARGKLIVYTTGYTDTYGYLLREDGRQITRNDDGGSGTNFRIVYRLSAGTYYIKVRDYYSYRTGAYSLHVAFRADTSPIAPDDIGNDMDTSTVIGISHTPHNLEILPAGDVDYLQFTLPVRGIINIFTAGNTDTYGRLYSANGTVLAENNNGGSGNNFRISRPLSVGRYYVEVKHNSPTGTGHYALTVSMDWDHGDDTYVAAEINLNSTTPARIDGAGDLDFFKITLPSTGTLSVFTTGRTDTFGYLLREDGAQITSDDDGGSGTNFSIAQHLSAGTYYIKVRDYYSHVIAGEYSLVVRFNASASNVNAPSDDHGNTRATATNIGLGDTRSGRIDTHGDKDYFKIEIPSTGGTLTVFTTGSTDTYGYLLRADGTQIALNDDSGSGRNFNIVHYLSAGTYYVKVRHYSWLSTGDYSLHVNYEANTRNY